MRARLLVVGGGNMGTALVRGLLASGWEATSLAVAESDAGRRHALAHTLPGVALGAEPVAADGVVVAVKPPDAARACRQVAATAPARVLSIMAGVRLAALESWLGPSAAVLRAMPNTPALVGAGISALAPGDAAGDADLEWAEGLLGAVGETVRVPEASLDAVTALSGSGPGYLFYLAGALIESGVSLGLPEAVSRALVLQTFSGSARMLQESGETPETLRARVASPGGTTEAGLAVLAEHGVAEAFGEAVAAAAERSRELGR